MEKSFISAPSAPLAKRAVNTLTYLHSKAWTFSLAEDLMG
jgi:hypothetical protein